MSEQVPARAMVIFAHPDDIEYYVGGTVATWATAGCEVAFLLTTSGENGCDDPALTSQQVAATRQAEERAAAEILGARQVVFLDAPDGEVAPTLHLRRQIVAEIRRYRPDIVVIPDPTRFYFFEQGYVNHPDHRATGEAALAALAPAVANARYHPELSAEALAPHAVREIWLAIPPQPDWWVDISAVFETKRAAMHCHRSQIRDTARLDDALRRWTETTDAEGNFSHREGFRRLVVA
jgi:LmbE family N-acetylglucosaminyl deacetylase